MAVQNLFEDDVGLYKYIPRRYINTLLEEKKLYFRQVIKWPDMMEIFWDKIINPNNSYSRYGSCWTLHRGVAQLAGPDYQGNALNSIVLNGVESMWRTYCPKGGIRIRTTIGKVKNAVQEYCQSSGSSYDHGPVIYKDHKDTKNEDIKRSCFIKSPSFYTDDEYRFVITKENFGGESLEVPIVNAADFVDEILISPPELTNCRQIFVSRQIYDHLERINNNEFSLAEAFGGKPFVIRKSVLYGRWA